MDAVEASLSSKQGTVKQNAVAASSSCAMSPIHLSLSGSGSTTHLKSFRIGGPSALRTSCTSAPGQLAISVATSKGIPLRNVVGSNLGLGIVRSKKDSPGGQLSVVFNHGSGAGSTTTGGTGATWSGTWTRTVGVTGNLILQQSGSNVTGHYTWSTGGTVQGTITGPTLTATFDETNYKGTITLTLAGTHFTGSYSGIDKLNNGPVSGPLNGTCSSGACLKNGSG